MLDPYVFPWPRSAPLSFFILESTMYENRITHCLFV